MLRNFTKQLNKNKHNFFPYDYVYAVMYHQSFYYTPQYCMSKIMIIRYIVNEREDRINMIRTMNESLTKGYEDDPDIKHDDVIR